MPRSEPAPVTDAVEVGPPPPADVAPARSGRWWWVAAAAVAVVLAFLAGLRVAGGGGEGQPQGVPPADEEASPASPWMTGASGTGVATGDFGEWRGQPVRIAATWVDNDDASVALAPLQEGEEYGDWQESLDVAVGAFDDDGSWEDAADGDYEDRWRESLTGLREAWESRPGTMYIRFAHEMNGDWYPWSVDEDDAEDFVDAWGLYRDLQQEIFPESQLVFSVNRESVETGIDWRETFPGAEEVDVMSVDYYNQFPYVETQEEWDEAVVEVDEEGGPKGLQRHLDFAAEVGLPLAVSEWSGNADEGDSPLYIEQMHAFFEENAGTGPGELLYEIQYNRDRDDRRWLLYGEDSRMPESAERYQELW